MKGEVKRKFSPWSWRPEFFLSASSPCNFSCTIATFTFLLAVREDSDARRAEQISAARIFIRGSSQRPRLLKRDQPNWLVSANHGSIGDSRPMASWGYPRGPRVGWANSGRRGETGPNGQKETHPRTRASAEPRTKNPGYENPDLRWTPARRSSGLRFQMLDVETFSFLPQS